MKHSVFQLIGSVAFMVLFLVLGSPVVAAAWGIAVGLNIANVAADHVLR